MSVLIKGMKMPKGCYECPLMDFEYGECGAGATGEYDPYCKDCPLEDLNVLCALADRECPFQGKEYAWCLTCPHISEEDRALVKKAVAEPKTGKWELDPDGMDWNIPAWRCSECGFRASYIGVEANGFGNNPMNWAGSKFCPQCGARITGYER